MIEIRLDDDGASEEGFMTMSLPTNEVLAFVELLKEFGVTNEKGRDGRFRSARFYYDFGHLNLFVAFKWD